MARFRHLPLSLQGVFLVLALAPLAAMVAVAHSSSRMASAETMVQLLAAMCYVVLPATLALLLLKRHPAFLYLLIPECAGLLLAAFFKVPQYSPGFASIHYGYVVTMVLLAVMLINRDILFPFIFSGHRGFRQAPRVSVNQMVRVEVPRLGKTFEMMIEDCSLTGAALYGSEDQLDQMLAANSRGDPLLISCTIGRFTHQVPTTYLWQAKISSIIKIGLVARDPAAMSAMFHALGLRQTHRFRFKVAEIYMLPWVRRSLSYGLAAVMLALMIGLPIAREIQHKREKSGQIAH